MSTGCLLTLYQWQVSGNHPQKPLRPVQGLHRHGSLQDWASLTLQLRVSPAHAVWEMFYCQTAYEGLIEAQICVGVCDGTLRPVFDDTCPMPYQGIATSCWAQNPAER